MLCEGQLFACLWDGRGPKIHLINCYLSLGLSLACRPMMVTVCCLFMDHCRRSHNVAFFSSIVLCKDNKIFILSIFPRRNKILQYCLPKMNFFYDMWVRTFVAFFLFSQRILFDF